MRSRSLKALPWTFWSIACAITAWAHGFTTMQGSDLWWHLAIGRRILSTRAIPREDPYSFTTEGRSWLIDSWLSDTSLAAWADLWSMESLAYWKWAVLALTAIVLFVVVERLARKLAVDAPARGTEAPGRPVDAIATMSGAWLAVWLGLASAEAFVDIRPQLYSLLFFAAACGLTLLPRRWNWVLVPFFVLWANLHAGYVLGLLVLGIVGFWRFRAGQADERRRLLWIGGASVLACLLTPYGPETLVRPFRYAFDTSSPFRTIGEWRAPFDPGGIRSAVFPYAIGAWALSVASLFVFARGRMRSPALWGAVLISTLTLAMSLKSRRFVPFFSIAQALVVGPVVAAGVRSLLSRWSGRPARPSRRQTPAVAGSESPRWLVLALVLPLVAGAALLPKLLRYPLDSRAFIHLTAWDAFPVDTFDFIEANELSGEIFNYYNWGGYTSLRTKGTLQTYIDGRAGTVYSDETFRAYQIVLGGQGQTWISLVEATEAAYFLWPIRRTQWSTLVATGRWRIIHQDAVSALLARNDRVSQRKWSAPPEGPYRFMALGALLAASNRTEEAERMLARAHQGLPNMGRACYELAMARFRTGKVEEARATMRECHECFPHRGRAAAWKTNTGFDP